MDRIGPVELRSEWCGCGMMAKGHGPAPTDCPCGITREHGHCLYCGGVSGKAGDQLQAPATAVSAVAVAQRARALWAKIDDGIQRIDVLAAEQYTVDGLCVALDRLTAVWRAVRATGPVGEAPSEPVSDHGGDATGEGARAQAQLERERDVGSDVRELESWVWSAAAGGDALEGAWAAGDRPAQHEALLAIVRDGERAAEHAQLLIRRLDLS